MTTSQQPLELSDHFTYREATFSRTAIKRGLDNTPDEKQLANIIKTANQMEKVRALLGNKVIHVSSWFRATKVNAAVGGSSTSQHMTGEAVDFYCPRYGSERKICETIVAHKELIPFDQLILEPSWVHISFLSDRRKKPRYDVKTKTPDGKYHPGLIYYK